MPDIAQTRLNELYALASEIHGNIEQQSFRLQTLMQTLRALGADDNPPATRGKDWKINLDYDTERTISDEPQDYDQREVP